MSTNEPMTQERLDAIQERLNARTPGEWRWNDDGELFAQDGNGPMLYCGNSWPEDRDLIANAPQDLADLLAEVERLRTRAALADAMIERVARDTAAKEPFTGRRQWEDLPHDERTYLRAHAHRVLAADLTPQEGA